MEEKIRYMQMKQISTYTGIPYNTLKKLKRTDPAFPEGIKFSERLILYRREDVDSYIESKANKRAGA